VSILTCIQPLSPVIKVSVLFKNKYSRTVYANRASCLPKEARQSDWENASQDTGAAFEQRE